LKLWKENFSEFRSSGATTLEVLNEFPIELVIDVIKENNNKTELKKKFEKTFGQPVNISQWNEYIPTCTGILGVGYGSGAFLSKNFRATAQHCIIDKDQDLSVWN